MAQLSAFVGHSFLEIDQLVVTRILAVLDTISKLMPGFEWDHAQAAEPKELSQKVKEKMAGKNLFIGICTAKERVIDPQKLRRRWWFLRDEVIAERGNFVPKTSDWIIQEIGMAVGREMQIVLLVEQGLREPGGLQGDLEYIPFNRSEPEKCLEKLAEMLRSLVPLAAPAGEATQAASSAEAEIPGQAGDPIREFLTPNGLWTADDFVRKNRLAILWHEEDIHKAIVSAFNESELAKLDEAQAHFQAAAISAGAEAQKGDWVEPLTKLAKRYPEQPGPYIGFAERFEATGDHSRAAENYTHAARLSTVPLKKMKLLIRAGQQRQKAGQTTEAEALLAQGGDVIAANPDIESDGMARLAAAWSDLGNTQLFAACAERCLELAPDRPHPRFDLAYKYSNAGEQAQALFHYRQYLKVKDDPDGWNNLGVSAISLKLPATGIEAYREADQGGNTLATSNLVFALLEAGFLAEATSLCVEGLKRPNPNPRLSDAMARCTRLRAEETEKETELLLGTASRRGILRSIGHASIVALKQPLPQKWRGPRCELALSESGSQLTLTGTYARRNLLGGLGLFGKEGEGEKTIGVTITYTGRLIGHAFIGKLTETTGGAATTLLGSDEGKTCIGTLDPALRQFELLENDKDRTTLTAM